MKLYEIANDYLALMQAIENDELPEDAIADTLEAIEGEIEEKADNIGCVLKEIEAEINAFKTEEQRLAERRKRKEKLYEKLKTYLSETLQRIGVDRVETTRNIISFRKSEAVEVDEEKFLKWANEQFNRDDLIISTYFEKANKTEIKRELKAGIGLPYATLVTKQNIQLN
jgi:hypothetical protein